MRHYKMDAPINVFTVFLNPVLHNLLALRATYNNLAIGAAVLKKIGYSTDAMR